MQSVMTDSMRLDSDDAAHRCYLAGVEQKAFKDLTEADIHWVCAGCGALFGRKEPTMATWHEGPCDVCTYIKPVTEPRDFGGLEL